MTVLFPNGVLVAWAEPRAGLDAVRRERNSFSPCRESNPRKNKSLFSTVWTAAHLHLQQIDEDRDVYKTANHALGSPNPAVSSEYLCRFCRMNALFVLPYVTSHAENSLTALFQRSRSSVGSRTNHS